MIPQEQIQFLAHKALQIRIDSLRASTQAGSGHPTSCLSAADIIAVVYFHVLKYDYCNPHNPNNDRFILSKGHAVPVIYAALHQMGVISEQDLLSYRRIDSPFEGHPTPRLPFNEAATGSLGQGLAVGLGMALNARYETLPYKTYVMMGDGEIAEGSVWEAAALASHYKVNNLVGIVDCNKWAQSGTSLDAHDVATDARKFEAFGWKTVIIDGHDITQIISAFEQAQQVKDQPFMIVAKTLKGYGLEGIEDKNGFHGKPFKKDELAGIIEKLNVRFAGAADFKGNPSRRPDGLLGESDIVSPSPRGEAAGFVSRGSPHLPQPLQSKSTCNTDSISLDLTNDVNASAFAKDKAISTRKAFGYALQSLGKRCDKVFALDGDVKNSTFTELFEKECPERFIQCYIAEQNMVGVSTGLALRGKVPFAATFACFFSRAYDQIRMAGIGRVALRLCGSHSGVSIGQDGPSQMGLEDVGMFRAIPQSVVVWPSDGVSTCKLVEQMALYNDGVSYMKTTRGDTPMIYDANEVFPFGGSKVLKKSDNDQVCIVAAGITLHEGLKAYELLKKEGINVAVIDLYSIKPLDVKTLQTMGLASNKTILTVEDHYLAGGIGETVAASLNGTGIRVHSLAVTELPRSGSPEELMKWAGIDAEGIVRKVKGIC